MQSIRHLKHIIRWHLHGKPKPPPHVIKQLAIKHYQRRFSLKVFVETGTYLGDMVAAVKSRFEKIYSIELSLELYQRARQVFSDSPNVHLVHGDSSEMLASVLERISTPALFWLDGHFSDGVTARGKVDNPILEELDLIRRHPIKTHVILIDDARMLVRATDTPAKEDVIEKLKAINPAYKIEEEADIIRAFVLEN
jgi:hypothetical protein